APVVVKIFSDITLQFSKEFRRNNLFSRGICPYSEIFRIFYHITIMGPKRNYNNYLIVLSIAGFVYWIAPTPKPIATQVSDEVPAIPFPCHLGKEYQDGCTRCICNDDGVATCERFPICNRSQIGSTYVTTEHITPFVWSDTKGECIIGHKFFYGCNFCQCFGCKNEHDKMYRCDGILNCRDSLSDFDPGYYAKRIPVGKIINTDDWEIWKTKFQS
ncbi:unnamed protein product, partial [Allacma fusca]